MTTTKHEEVERCNAHIRDDEGFFMAVCRKPKATCHHTKAEPTGAGMREEFVKYAEFDKDFILDNRAINAIADWWIARLSRLNSRIAEEGPETKSGATSDMDAGYSLGWNICKELYEDVINQAFKDL